MNEDQINDFYKNDFPNWLQKISLFHSDNQNFDLLIRPEDINLIPNENKKHIFSLLVFYNFLIHLFMYHHFGPRYQQKFPNLVPYKNITNTLNGLDPFIYINIPLQERLLKENIIRNICEKVFLICGRQTINYFNNLENFNTVKFFNDFFNEPEYRISSPAYIMITLGMVIDKLISENK